jgi:hypothetical protein
MVSPDQLAPVSPSDREARRFAFVDGSSPCASRRCSANQARPSPSGASTDAPQVQLVRMTISSAATPTIEVVARGGASLANARGIMRQPPDVPASSERCDWLGVRRPRRRCRLETRSADAVGDEVSAADYERVQHNIGVVADGFDLAAATPRADRHLEREQLPRRSARSRGTGYGVGDARRLHAH